MTMDNMKNTMATVDAMKTANKELRKTYGKVSAVPLTLHEASANGQLRIKLDIDKIEVYICGVFYAVLFDPIPVPSECTR